MNCSWWLLKGEVLVIRDAVATVGMLVAIASQFGCAAVSTRSTAPCTSTASADCLSKNLDEMYMHHESSVWAVLARASDLSLLCSASDEPSKFIQLIVAGRGNSEFAEYYHETVERMFM